MGKFCPYLGSVKLENKLSNSKIQWRDRHRVDIPISKGRKWKGQMAYWSKQVWNPSEQLLLDYRPENSPLWLKALSSVPVVILSGLNTCGWALRVILSLLYPISVPFCFSRQCFLWYKILKNLVGLPCNAGEFMPSHQRVSTDEPELYCWLLPRLVESVSHSPDFLSKIWFICNLFVLSRACFLIFCSIQVGCEFSRLSSAGFFLFITVCASSNLFPLTLSDKQQGETRPHLPFFAWKPPLAHYPSSSVTRSTFYPTVELSSPQFSATL